MAYTLEELSDMVDSVNETLASHSTLLATMVNRTEMLAAIDELETTVDALRADHDELVTKVQSLERMVINQGTEIAKLQQE